MKRFNFKNSLVLAFIATAATVAFSSCDKDKDNTKPTYPQKVKIGYSISSPAKDITTGKVVLTDKAGKDSTIAEVTLPYTLNVERTVAKAGDKAALSFTAAKAGKVKLEITVDSKAAESKEFTLEAAKPAAITYTFK